MPKSTTTAFLLLLPTILLGILFGCGGESGTGLEGNDDGTGTNESVPDAPTSLAATPVSKTAIDLSWVDTSDEETGFEIQRSPDGTGTWITAATPGADAVAHTDTGLEPGTAYRYRIRAVGTGGASDYSGVAAATTHREAMAAVMSLEDVVAGVLPPAGTSPDQRDLSQEVLDVADALASVPEIDTVLVHESTLTVQALLREGYTYLFINNRPYGVDESTASPVSVEPQAADPGPTPGPSRVDGPPGSARAVVASYDGGAAVAGEVAQMLTNAGYDVQSLGASLADMRQYKDLGVLHLDTHGVPFVRAVRNSDGSLDVSRRAFGLQTSTVVQGGSLTAWSAELESGALLFSAVPQEDGSVRTKLAVTEKFIAEHWTFDGGVVLLHACYGGANPFSSDKTNDQVVDPGLLRAAMLGKGARLVMAFDNLTWTSFARPSILHFFDRMLGADSYDPQDPPLRPFDDLDVISDMQEKGLLQFTRPSTVFLGQAFGGNEVNVTFDRTGDRTTLAPSIRTMDVLDDAATSEGELTLHGLFGGDPGTVEVNGQELTLELWTEDLVKARVPYQGTAARGDVVAIKPDGVESNEAPLTEWAGTLTVDFVLGKGSLRIDADIDVRFRADLHRFRQRLSGSLEERPVRTYISPASQGDVTGSGTYTDSEGATLTFFGSESFEILTRAEVDAGGPGPLEPRSTFGGFVELDPVADQVELCFSLFGGTMSRTVSQAGTQEQRTQLLLLPMELFHGTVDGMRCLFLPLGSDYRIPQGQTTFQADEVSILMKWSAFDPTAAPDNDTPG